MDNKINMSREELEQYLEKAKRELQERLDAMTPEERAATEARAQKMIEEDNANTQRLLDDAARILGRNTGKARPNFCAHCGAPAGSGKYCEYCGSLLE